LRAIGQKVGVAARYRDAREEEPMLEVRAFADPVGIPEDPVTGSLNASLAQWLIDEGHMPVRYIAAQGACLGRAGRVHVERDDHGQVWVGGQSVTCIDGSVLL
jgi:PhzF family phenazine biosynthesis protein